MRGRPDSETDGNGNKTVYEKDRWGHVTKVTLPDGGIEKYHYDFAGNLNVAEDANGNRTVFRYRGDNRIRSIQKENKSIKYFWYDSEKLCQERATEQAYYQGKEALAVFHAFEKAYGNIENGDSHRYEKALKEGLCGEPGTGRESSSYNRHYVWDFRGNLLKQKDSLGGTWKYAYDLTGRLASATNPVGDKTSYVYDRFGRERSRVNGMGDCEYTLDYDALGRVTARTDGEGNLVDASENGTDYHYTHDTEGRVLSKRAWGKILYENHYDACGRLRELITGE